MARRTLQANFDRTSFSQCRHTTNSSRRRHPLLTNDRPVNHERFQPITGKARFACDVQNILWKLPVATYFSVPKIHAQLP